MNAFKTLAILFVATSLAACQKNEMPGDGSFTDCRNCTFTFHQQTGMSGTATGNSDELVFSFKNYWNGRRDSSSPYRGLTFNVPTESTSFHYGKEEITSDKVTYIAMCINCGMIAYQAVDGKISGKKIDNHRWLVEANVTLKATHMDTQDTITFKQYFTKTP